MIKENLMQNRFKTKRCLHEKWNPPSPMGPYFLSYLETHSIETSFLQIKVYSLSSF